MRDDDTPVSDGGRDLRQNGGDVLVRQTVKSVALNARVADVLGQRNELRNRWLTAMKAGVEARDLRDVGKVLGDGVDGGKVMRLVQRREGNQSAQVLQYFRRDERRSRIARATVDDPMADAQHLRAAVTRAQPRGEDVERRA